MGIDVDICLVVSAWTTPLSTTLPRVLSSTSWNCSSPASPLTDATWRGLGMSKGCGLPGWRDDAQGFSWAPSRSFPITDHQYWYGRVQVWTRPAGLGDAWKQPPLQQISQRPKTWKSTALSRRRKNRRRDVATSPRCGKQQSLSRFRAPCWKTCPVQDCSSNFAPEDEENLRPMCKYFRGV